MPVNRPPWEGEAAKKPGANPVKELPALPDPLDIQQATEEEIVSYMFILQQAKSELNASVPELIRLAADAKRNLDAVKSQVKFCTESVSMCQSVLRSMRPQ